MRRSSSTSLPVSRLRGGATEVIWSKGEQEFLALVCCRELKGDRESAVSHTADLKHIGSRRHLGNMKLAIRPCGSGEPGSGNRYLNFAEWFTALGISDSSVNGGCDGGAGGKDNQ